MTSFLLLSLTLVAISGAIALYQLFSIGEDQTRHSRSEAGIVLLFTLSSIWMAIHICVDPLVVQTYDDAATRFSYEIISMARNLGMCWFNLRAYSGAARQRKKRKQWGAYHYGFRRTDTGDYSRSRVFSQHKFPR